MLINHQMQRVVGTSVSKRNRSCVGIGDRSIKLSQLSDVEFMKHITATRERFSMEYPHLTNTIFEYNKQCTLLELNFWYEKPVPPRCEKFCEMEINSLLYNIDEETEEGKAIVKLCNQLLREYIPHKYDV